MEFDPEDYIYPNFVAVMRDNTTGEIRNVPMGLAWYDHSNFMWNDGNFSCDCNRSLFFYNHDRNKEYECGYTKISVLKMIFPDGTETIIDGESV